MTFPHRLLCFLSLLVASTALLWAVPPGKSGWKSVEDALSQGKPKTAIKALQSIEREAQEQGNDAAWVHAVAQRIQLEASIRGSRPAEKIHRMKVEIAKASPQTQPVLQTILAKWYWEYFTQNRWQFAQRTQMNAADPSDDDFLTWDLQRILQEIDLQFRNAFEHSKTLQQIKVTDYADLLEPGNTDHVFRPSLYDVVAEAAIEFYSAGEQGGTQSADAFEIDSQSPIFASLESFLKYVPDTDDKSSPDVRATRLFQDVLRFHQRDEDPTARLDWDLKRLRFGNNRAVGEGKLAKYQSALHRFSAVHKDHFVSAMALHELALTQHAENKWTDAHRTATLGLQRFPKSVGGKRCHHLIQQIEASELSVIADPVWCPSKSPLHLQYRNLDTIYFRIVKREIIAKDSQRMNPRFEDHFLNPWTTNPRRLLRLEPVIQWTEKVSSTEDFQRKHHSVDTTRIKDLPLGSYWLITSAKPDFSEADNHVSYNSFWRSELALVVRTHDRDGFLEGLVTDAETGQPIEGARIDAYIHRQDNRFEKQIDVTLTNNKGLFRFETKRNQSVRFVVRHQEDQLGTLRAFSIYRNRRKMPDQQQAVLFTDRSIYRPGQTIQYKGICYVMNHRTGKYEVLGGHDVTVVYRDINGQEIEMRNHRTNDYGSFSGSFTAPRDRAMGAMSIHLDRISGGHTSVRVEEYKRPKFRVELNEPKDTAKLGDRVTMTGVTTAYNGAPIDSAKVTYRVVRNVRHAPWWRWRCWWMPIHPVPAKEIAHGTVRTDAQGKFEIPFVAHPDRSVDQASEPTFTYTVFADVTDSAGETRSDRASVSLGYSAIKATLSAGEFLTSDKPTQIKIHVTGLYGDENVATGTVKIYRLKQPDQVTPAEPRRWGHRGSSHTATGPADPEPDPSNPNSWELGEWITSIALETRPDGNQTIEAKLPSGIFRAVAEVSDKLGNHAKAYVPLQVLDLSAKRLDIKVPFLLSAKRWTAEPGETFHFYWGSGYETARVLIEVEHQGRILSQKWSDPDRTQGGVAVPIKPSMRGGLIVRTTMIRNNHAIIKEQTIDVPWDNKKLIVTWERFVSKLQPGAKETWTAIVKSKEGKPVTGAELMATLYDGSLDAFVKHSFRDFSSVFYRNRLGIRSMFQNRQRDSVRMSSFDSPPSHEGTLSYWRFPDRLMSSSRNLMVMHGRGSVPTARMEMRGSTDANGLLIEKSAMVPYTEGVMAMGAAASPAPPPMGDDGEASTPDSINFDHVSLRKNMQETAFFFPSLVTRNDGSVEMSFTMPEALTEWKFMGMIHDKKLRSGWWTDTVVTAKDLMVQPNAPRFVREGDQLDFTVKITNQSPTVQTGTIRLTFADFRTGDSVDAKLSNVQTDQSFTVPAGQSKTRSWKIQIPDGLDFVTYKAVGSTGSLSDGEEGYLPVLSRRVLVHESMSLPIRGMQTKRFDFKRLLESKDSDSIEHQLLAVQVVSNPSWYAILSLPYLMEYPHQCSEQTFNRYYANSLARHIVTRNPKIKRVFDAWRSTPVLDSPLEKNEDLKSIAILETPWKRDAVSESQARRDVGILFDQNRLDDEKKRAMTKLAQMQSGDGSWPWFDGGPTNEYLTLYIATGMGRLRHLGVESDPGMPRKAFAFLDGWMNREFRKLKTSEKRRYQLSSTVALYLYGRSFFLKELPISAENQKAFTFWKAQAKKHWPKMQSRQTQAHLALALHRMSETKIAKAIAESLKEHSLDDEELGMYWDDAAESWWWYHAPIESQAMMIEVFDEVMNDQASVEACKVWLIKQRQTNSWPTTRSTADAVYGLLLRGSDLLASDELVRISLGGNRVEPKNVEAGTGYYEKRFVQQEVTSRLGHVEMTKVDVGVAWGSLHWQYLEDIGKVTSNQTGPLKLSKRLFIKKNTTEGPKLVPLTEPADVGDELVVRLILRTDRDMEFVHLKDHRGSGTEPVNVLSGYRSQDGLGFYESTRDTATHFFIDYLPKGDYVFEYSTRVQLRGRYQTGFAHIECMYAPEFDSHSESIELVVGQ